MITENATVTNTSVRSIFRNIFVIHAENCFGLHLAITGDWKQTVIYQFSRLNINQILNRGEKMEHIKFYKQAYDESLDLNISK